MKKTRRWTKRSGKTLAIDRRTFVKLAGAATLTATVTDAPLAQQSQGSQASQKITREMMNAAEQMIGIELTEAQEEMALPGVNRNLTSYESLRKIDVPLDTEPAIAFHPAPGKKF